MSKTVGIEIYNERTADVDAGFQLYADLTAATANLTVPRNWFYWYDQNPFGKGIYAVARCGEKVVGFYSLIPLEMRINGHLLAGAKGECFVVAPDFRSSVCGPKGMRLPVTLSSELHSAASRYGIRCIFLYGTPAATLCHTMAGATTIAYNIDRYTMVFRSSCGPTFVSRCKCFLAAQYSVARLGIGMLQRLGGKRGHFRIVDDVVHVPETSGRNVPVSNSDKMLNYRFPASHYLWYATTDVNGEPAVMVFNTPRQGAQVSLKHWSCRPLPFENVIAVLCDVIRRAHLVKATALSIVVPTCDQDSFGSLKRFGFIHRHSRTSIQIYTEDKDIGSDAADWRFTNSHSGFFGFA